MQGFDKFSSAFGGDAIKVKIKDGYWRPNLSTDRNHFRADTSRPPGEHLRQVSKTWIKRQRSGTDTIEFHFLPQTPNGEGTQNIKTA